MPKHPELKGLNRMAGLTAVQIADNKRSYQRIYARKRRAGWSDEKREEIAADSRSRYGKLDVEGKAKYIRRVQLWRYGLTPEEYDALVEEQNGVCAICGNPPGEVKFATRLAVDHCHKTGKNRGLLCRPCNLALGHFEDDVNRMESAIVYLKKHGGSDECP